MPISKKKLLKLLIFLLLFLFFTLLVILPIISTIGIDDFFIGTKDFVRRLKEDRILIRGLLPLVPLAALCLLLYALTLAYPFVSLFFERLFRYMSLCFACIRNKYSVKINQFKFSNSYIISEQPNVTIGKGKETYFLHFLDIPRADKRVVVFQSDSEYRVYETVKSKKSKKNNFDHTLMENEDIPKIFRKRARILDENKYQSFQIPKFEKTDSQIHMILLSPKFLYLKQISNGVILDIGREAQIGSVFVAKFKKFKKNM